MARTSVSLPDQLHVDAKRAGVNVSDVCRRALELELVRVGAHRLSGRNILDEVLTDRDAVAERLRATRRQQDDEHLGYELGATWAAAEAPLRDLEEVVNAATDGPPDEFEGTVSADNAMFAFIETRVSWQPSRNDYSATGGPVLVSLFQAPLLRGFQKGATAVYRQVSPLVNPPLPRTADGDGPDEAPF